MELTIIISSISIIVLLLIITTTRAIADAGQSVRPSVSLCVSLLIHAKRFTVPKDVYTAR